MTEYWKNWNRNGLLKTEIEENQESKMYCLSYGLE